MARSAKFTTKRPWTSRQQMSRGIMETVAPESFDLMFSVATREPTDPAGPAPEEE